MRTNQLGDVTLGTSRAFMNRLVALDNYKRTKDPLMVCQNALLAEQTLTEDLIKQIDDSARAEAETSAQFAEQSPYPTIEDIKKDVYWEVDNPQDKKSVGSLFFD